MYLDHGKHAGTCEARGASELFGGIELILKVLLGDWCIIGEDWAVVETLIDLGIGCGECANESNGQKNTHDEAER